MNRRTPRNIALLHAAIAIVTTLTASCGFLPPPYEWTRREQETQRQQLRAQQETARMREIWEPSPTMVAARNEQVRQNVLDSAREDLRTAVERDAPVLATEAVTRGELRGGQLQKFVDLAVARSGCVPKVLEVIVDNGGILGTAHVSKMVEQPCLDALVSFAPKMKVDDLAAATRSLAHKLPAEPAAEDMNALDLFRTLGVLQQESMATCRVLGPPALVCSASDYAQARMRAFEERIVAGEAKARAEARAADARVASGGTFADRICALEREISEAKAAIDEQRQIAKVAGTLDETIMYDAGKRIVSAQKQMTAHKNGFRKHTGRSFKRGDWCERSDG